MKITPIEIRQKEFEKVFRGYEKEAVDAYLQSLSVEWERLLDENRTLAKRLETTEKEVERMREVESSLFRTLKSAEDTGNTMIESANKKAELYLREAQMNAETMLTEARYKAKSMLEDAEEQVREITGDLDGDIKIIEERYRYFSDLKDNMVREIKNLIMDFNDRLSRQSDKASEARAFENKVKESKNLIKEQRTQHHDEIKAPVIEPLKPIHIEKPELPSNSSGEEGSFFDKL